MELIEHRIYVNEELWWNGAVSDGFLAGTALDQILANFFLKYIESNANLSRDNT